jgi:hypothetical protein
MVIRPYQFDLIPRNPKNLQTLPNNSICKWSDCESGLRAPLDFKDTCRISNVSVSSDINFRYSDMLSSGFFLREALSPIAFVSQGLQVSMAFFIQKHVSAIKNPD